MMNDTDRQNMVKAIAEAEQCRPAMARYPKVGAVIAIDDVVLGSGHRDTGADPKNDDHAEKHALSKVAEPKQLPRATLYTTLEPCTPEVRRVGSECCTELIKQAGIKRVFIGILDPNQGVRGKGLWELQDSGVDVELFPPDLASEIRTQNRLFIKEQQSLGIRITNVKDGDTLKTHETGGVFELEGTFLNAPGEDVVAFANVGGRWWPQPYRLKVTSERDRTWSVKVHFGSYAAHTVLITRVSELGMALVNYYRQLSTENMGRKSKIEDYIRRNEVKDPEELRRIVRPVFLGVEMATLPKGIQVLDQVQVNIENPDTTATPAKQ
jgi:diaminohydroxyphosphoribosylaminopyrimidine deaminase/5-amino-6-(5-phosphoribosylamino)uracil reductase